MNIYLKKGSKGELVKKLQKALNLFPDGIFGKITEERVKEFQRLHGIKDDGIVGTLTWAKLFTSIIKKSKRRINEIIVHCTATPEGKDFTVDDITRWHRERGWSTIGYHYVIYRDGSVHEGRSVDIVGAHCAGHNSHSIGVCYVGGCAKNSTKPKDTRTQAQKESLLNLIKELKKLYPDAHVYSHCYYDKSKACPSFNATKEYMNI